MAKKEIDDKRMISLLKESRQACLIFVTENKMITISKKPGGVMSPLETSEFLADALAEILGQLVNPDGDRKS